MSCVNMATRSSSEEGLASSVSNLMYGGGCSICSMIIGGNFLSMSLSDIDDLLPDLSDDDISDLPFLRTKTQATRAARAAPTKMQPIAMPTVWPRESRDLSFDESKGVCTTLGEGGVAVMVGNDGLSLSDVRVANVSFGGIAPNDVIGFAKVGEVVVPPLTFAVLVGDDLDVALGEGDVFMSSVPPFGPSKVTAVGTGFGRSEGVMVALSWKMKGAVGPETTTHG